MSRDELRPLTKRQQAVIERIDKRTPIKGIARELGVSETRINQHIRALKNIYKAENLSDLVEAYRTEKRTSEKASGAKTPNGFRALIQMSGALVNLYTAKIRCPSAR
jgi:DNA-binding CsgD family transcriptional regulator